MTGSGISYQRLVQEALRSVVRETLRQVARDGLPGEHHFYISFHTGHPDLDVAGFLLQQYPEEMTVVLQHQFWDLEVEDDRFAVTLSFGGRQERLVVPFAALTAFVDPHAQFGLKFDAPGGVEALGSGEVAGEEPPAGEPSAGESQEDGPEPPAGGPGNVLSFDKSRKR